MEMHHRRARPSNGGPSADAPSNGTSTSPPKRTYGPVKARAVAHNPYAAVANTTDVVLHSLPLRSKRASSSVSEQIERLSIDDGIW